MNYTQEAIRTESRIDRINVNPRLLHAVFGLVTEVGELVDPIKQHIFYGVELDKVNLQEEYGDICWYLAILADYLQISDEDLKKANIEKLRRRYPEKFTQESAIDRDIEHELGAFD